MRSASLPCCISPMSGAVSVSGRHSGARWRSQSASACRRASASSLCSIRCRRRWRCCTRRWRSSCWRSRSCMPSGSPRRARARAYEWRRFHRHRERDTMRGNGISEAPRVLEVSHNGDIDVVFFYPKPVVAAINGHAIAGGCVLACAADQRLMARGSGRIGVTELLVGLPYPAIALEIMRFTAVPAYFREVIFGGGRYPAEAAATRGLVDVIVDPEALLADAVEAARSLASLAPAAFALTKSQTRQPVLDQLQKYGDVFDAAADEIWLAPESASRIRDYVSRTF